MEKGLVDVGRMGQDSDHGSDVRVGYVVRLKKEEVVEVVEFVVHVCGGENACCDGNEVVSVIVRRGRE